MNYQMTDVFVPGGLPEHTYVPRAEKRLEERLRAASENLCKLVTVTGPTKSGKTVLTQTKYSRDKAVWIDGGAFSSEDGLWSDVVEQLGAFTQVGESKSRGREKNVEFGFEGQGSLFVAKVGGSIRGGFAGTHAEESTRSRVTPAKSTALDSLRKSGIPLVIDDFHYLPREVQGAVVRALKAVVFAGHPTILLAIPHRRYDAIRVEKEMAGRVESIEVPAWEPAELIQIPEVGFRLLNVEVENAIVDRFTVEALGSPHLMQDFCRCLCEQMGVKETSSDLVRITGDVDVEGVFRHVAQSTSGVVFDRLQKGPRPRRDRISRRLRDGSTADIYVVVLRAIARLHPGVETIEYEDIRRSLREVLVLDEEPPAAGQVSRVLEHMMKISAAGEGSSPVMDWEAEERRLHITDPFFAFFLKWGL